MPDRDVLPRSVPRGWAKPYKLLLGNASPLEVAVATARALAGAVRRGGGLPGFAASTGIALRVAARQLDPADGLRELRDIAHAAGGHWHTTVAAEQAIARLVVEIADGASVTGRVEGLVAERLCRALVEHALLGRVRDKLVGQRFASHDEALAWEQKLWADLGPAVCSIAAQLARDPTGKRVRAPRMGHRVRRSTAEMLHEPIGV